MQSVHAVQITWHSGSLPLRREIIRTLWGCEHLTWIQIPCSSNATIRGSSGNMQIFLKLQSWLWGWIIIFDSSFLSDITLGKAQCTSAWHAAFQTKASAFCGILCLQEDCCVKRLQLLPKIPIPQLISVWQNNTCLLKMFIYEFIGSAPNISIDVRSSPWLSARCSPSHFLTASPQQDRGENKVKKMLVGQDNDRDNWLLISYHHGQTWYGKN